MKRVALIGPVYPFKGGIAHYTGLLSRALSKRFTVRTISYSMQYPKLLMKREQKDYQNDSFAVEAEFLLNTANPFNIVKTAHEINNWKPDLVIIQWWHPYFALCYRILLSVLKAPVLYICHNVFPHEHFVSDRALTKLALKKGSCFILHSEKQIPELKEVVPEGSYAVNMHPTYEAFRFGEMPVKASGEKVLLFFGYVRPYKGLKYLLEALVPLPDVRLIVAGDFGGTREEYEAVMAEKGISGRVELHDGYTPDKEIEGYFARCDAVVLPYVSATGSGIAQLSFGFGKPIIATKAGSLPEVVKDGKTGVLCECASADSLSGGIRRFYELKEHTDFAEEIRLDSERFSWEHMVDSIENLAFR
ncbi:MAG: glycosyltransferase [Lachnospiraceae bacterium]|nr:glycosyltransferase [Lachnospiraceae bacterium]